ncbi:MAG: CinA family nicotinamide mononucleotide deamidase-related protein [Bacteroidales bacterium]|nr:CinA family nicotinamide mononucleotide deamidase-related protein [Bacteroidales bacterium]
MINAAICTIGDEILIGQIVDTNSAYISRELNRAGVRVTTKISIGDNFDDILKTLRICINENDLVVVTGGLGPTKDDITKKALSVLTNSQSFYYHDEQLEFIKMICSKRGLEVSDLNRDQALVPNNCIVIPNKMGTAPGMVFEIGEESKKLLVSLPGVPYEMEGMMPSVNDLISKKLSPGYIHHKTVVTYGIAEASLAKMLEAFEDNLDNDVKLAYLPNPSIGIRLRLSIYNRERESSIEIVERYLSELKSILGSLVYGEGEDTLETLIINTLKSKGKRLAIAESCTGGTIMSRLVSIPGSSEIISGGVITYSNESKINLLKVRSETLEKFGAVSRECAEEMAIGVKELYNADYAIATTGIAGPGGGTDFKPVGSVWVSAAGDFGVDSSYKVFTGDRTRNITRFSSEALNFLRIKIL